MSGRPAIPTEEGSVEVVSSEKVVSVVVVVVVVTVIISATAKVDVVDVDGSNCGRIGNGYVGRVYLGVVVFSSFWVVESHGNVGPNVARTAGLKVGL